MQRTINVTPKSPKGKPVHEQRLDLMKEFKRVGICCWKPKPKAGRRPVKDKATKKAEKKSKKEKEALLGKGLVERSICAGGGTD
jgi:hypothetical protein